MQNTQKKNAKQYAKYASNMQVLMILPYIACNMQNMQKKYARYAKYANIIFNMQPALASCSACNGHVISCNYIHYMLDVRSL